jgi:hypothetical protein
VLRGDGIRAAVGVGGSRVPRAPIAGVDRGHDAPPSGSGRRVVPSVTGIGAWPSWLGVGPAGVGTSASLAARAGNGLPVAFECLAFVVGEVELFEHLLDSALDLEELSFGGVLGEVEGAAGAGEAVGALGEEVVAACSAYRFQEWPAGAGPSRLALPRCPARLAQALARFWCPLSAMVTAVGWSAGGSPARTGLLNRHGIGSYRGPVARLRSQKGSAGQWPSR